MRNRQCWTPGDPRARAASLKGAAKSASTRRRKAIMRALDAVEPLMPPTLPPIHRKRVLALFVRAFEKGYEAAWQAAWAKYVGRAQKDEAA
jgi:hypothetical protein